MPSVDKNEIIRDLSSIIQDLNPTTINQNTIEKIKLETKIKKTNTGHIKRKPL